MDLTNYNPKKAAIVCFTAALYFFYEFIQLNMFNAIDPSLMKTFHISAAELGHISAYYFYGNLLFLFPAGMILDRISTRKIILTTMSISVVSTMIFATASEIWMAGMARLFIGMSASFCFLSCMRLASRWFPPRRLAVVIGLVVTMAMMGGMVAQTPLALLVDLTGWREALVVDGLVGAVILVAIFFVVRDYPAGAEQLIQQQRHSLATLGFWATLRKAISNRQNWLAGVYTSMMNLPIFLLGAMWGSLFLMQAHGLTHAQSTNVTAMIFVGTIIGSPVIGWLSDRLARRKLPMIICAVISLAAILTIMYSPHITQLTGMLLFLALGFFTSAQIISYPVIAESNPPALTGTASGLASTLIMAGGTSQPFFGWLMGLHWDHTMVDGVPVYAASDYHLALSIMPIAFVIALLVMFGLRETLGVRKIMGN